MNIGHDLSKKSLLIWNKNISYINRVIIFDNPYFCFQTFKQTVFQPY